jgi:cytochrome c-type biogenesis protein CcmH
MLLNPTPMKSSPPQANALDTLKQQLAQVDALMAQGVLKGDAAKSAREDLERQILGAVITPTTAAVPADAADEAAAAGALTPVDAPPASTKMKASLAAFVVAVGLLGYVWQGNHKGFSVGPGEMVAVAPADVGNGASNGAGPGEAGPTEAQVNEMIQRLADRLKEKPDDPTGWSMLARSYSAQGKFDLALPAYKRVMDLRPQDAQALADYADALAMVNGQSLDGEPEQLVMQAVQIDPANVKALSLAGTIAFNKAQYPQAVGYWERAVQASDPKSSFAAQLQGALTEARKRGGLPAVAGPAPSPATAPAPAPAPAQATTPGAPALVAQGPLATAPAASAGIGAGAGAAATATTVSGRVVLKAALKAQVSPDDTVFIFARAPTGSRMPLAILRKKVSDLPYDFSLDDSQAMSPAARLSSAQQVVVGARISKSGNAMPQAGDLQAFSAPVPVGTNKLTIEIGDLVP